MKNLFLIFFVIFSINSSGQKIKTIRTLTLSGTLVEYQYYKKNGKQIKHGYHNEYYKNGELKSKANYENNLLNGKCIDYYENKNISAKYEYRQGKFINELIKYYPNGKLMSYRNFTISDKVLKFGYDDGTIVNIEYVKDSMENYYIINSNDTMAIKNSDQNVDNIPKIRHCEFNYPIISKELGYEGVVIYRSVITKDKKINDIELIKGFDLYSIEQTKRSINCSVAYEPAKQNGVPIDYDYYFVIKYVLY